MFTEKFMEEMESPFQEQLMRMGEKGAEAAQAVKRAYEEGRVREAEALKCLYASMPLSDALDYPAELFEAYARHGVYLWEKGPFAGKVPEKTFAGYVLHHRVNNEDLTDHREFFYGELKDKIAGMSMHDALLTVNYWLASQATYRATDGRTASPLCVYSSAYGRCGEESTFGVSVLRSLGIPARQVYVPLWSHCDDNHAWVEAWADGKWVFLGACEPEEVVNKGWFTGASSRAMLVHSRWLLPTEPDDEDLGQAGSKLQVMPMKDMSHVLNHLGRYALTTEVAVEVMDEDGKPQGDVAVHFEVMNSAHFGEIATVRTDAEGKCFLRTGLGTLHVTAARDDLYGEALIDTQEGEVCRIVLKTPEEKMGVWEEMVITAPKDSPVNRVVLTEEQKREGKRRLAEAASQRKEKESRFYSEELTERAVAALEAEIKAEAAAHGTGATEAGTWNIAGTEESHGGNAEKSTAGLEDKCGGAESGAKKTGVGDVADIREKCVEIMRKACGNQKEIADFLSRPAAGRYPVWWKLALLESLREKDYRDITADILEDNCVETAGFGGNVALASRNGCMGGNFAGETRNACFGEEILAPYILCPRVWNEMIRPFRKEIRTWLVRESGRCGRNLAEEIRKNPVQAWKLVKERIVSEKKAEYGALVTSAKEALESGYGSEITREVVCVQILRTLGIPARLDPVEGMPEVWMQEPGSEGRFVPMEHEERTCQVIVKKQEGVEWNYFGNWTMARFEDGRYHTLMLGWGEQGKISGAVPVFPGKYRVLTTNRLPNGNTFAKQYFFELAEGETTGIVLEQKEAAVSDMLVSNDIADFALRTEKGAERRISELVREREGLFVWLGEDEEPTEHILNEIYERREEYAALENGIYFIAQRTAIRENPACRRALEALPKIELLLDDFGTDMEAVARRMYLEPGKLPLAVIIDSSMNCIYGVAGYNVGTGDMILKLLKLVSGE